MFLACLVDYTAPRFGVLVVGIMSYMYTFFLVVVTEIDDPCCRLWYIRDAPPDYREDDPRVYVQTRNGHRHRQHRRKDDVEVEFEN